jgi:hypothetical protein
MYIYLVQVIIVIVLYITYMYLGSLKTCNCVNQKYATNLKQGEFIFLLMAAIGLLGPFVQPFLPSSVSSSTRFMLMRIGLILAVLVLLFYIWFIYSTYKFVDTMQPDCACAERLPRYVVYLQSAVAFFIVVGSVFVTAFAAFNKIPLLPQIVSSLEKQTASPLRASLTKIRSSSRSPLKF